MSRLSMRLAQLEQRLSYLSTKPSLSIIERNEVFKLEREIKRMTKIVEREEQRTKPEPDAVNNS